MANLYGSICLTDIKDKAPNLIRIGKNGKKYLSICINEKRETDKYGYDHYIKVFNPDKNANAVYLGDLKTTEVQTTTESANAPQSANNAENNEAATTDPNSDLPF